MPRLNDPTELKLKPGLPFWERSGKAYFPNQGINNLFWKIKKEGGEVERKNKSVWGEKKREERTQRGSFSTAVKLRQHEFPLNYSKYLIFFYISDLLVLVYIFGQHNNWYRPQVTEVKWQWKTLISPPFSRCLPVYRSWSERCRPSHQYLWSWRRTWLRSSAPPGGNKKLPRHLILFISYMLDAEQEFSEFWETDS